MLKTRPIKLFFILIILLLIVFSNINLSKITKLEKSIAIEKLSIKNTYSYFDWRDAILDNQGYGVPGNGNGYDWTTSIKDQGEYCSSCTLFAIIGVLESIVKIKEEEPSLDLDFSEQQLLSCYDKNICEKGVDISDILRWIKNNNLEIISESCLRYNPNDIPPCPQNPVECNGYRTAIKDYTIIEDPVNEAIKDLLIEKGPLVVDMLSSNNFKNYDGGIYTKKLGLSSHAVIIVGYDDSQQCWICKNSWGKNWGEDKNGMSWKESSIGGGWFRISYKAAAIDNKVAYIEYDAGSMRSLIVDITTEKKYEKPSIPVDFQCFVAGGKSPYQYHWDFGDGTTSTEKNPIHSYSSIGEYEIILTVNDDDGEEENISKIFIIDNPPTNLNLDGPNSGNINKICYFNATSIDIDQHEIFYKFDWGDGLESDWIGPFESGDNCSLSHSWDKQKSYTVKVKAKDTYDIETDWKILEISMPRIKYLHKLSLKENLFNILLNRMENLQYFFQNICF